MLSKFTLFSFDFIITLVLLLNGIIVTSCQENFQEKAAREAKDYTRKYCPTPPVNFISTDSVAYNAQKNTFIYYCTFSDKLDNPEVIEPNKKILGDALIKSVKESTQMKMYVDAGCHFRYVCHSKTNPQSILLEVNF